MASTNKMQKNQRSLYETGLIFYRGLASLKLAVGLMVLLAFIMAAATLMEKYRGRDYTLWYVYNSSWFIALLGLCALNILAALLIRYPWGKARIGFLLVH